MEPPRLLLLDTASPAVTIALYVGPAMIRECRFASTNHVRSLGTRLKELLANDVNGFDAVAINLGPGSFTGVRVGLTIAKALVFVGGQKLIGVDAFDVCAHSAAMEGFDKFAVVLDGQLQTVQSVVYRRVDSGFLREPLQIYPTSDLELQIDRTTPVVGPAGRWKSKLPAMVKCISLEGDATGLPSVATARFGCGQFDDPMLIEPFYARPSSAEEKWDARQAATS